MKSVSFSRVVSGAEPVANAFEHRGLAQLWWRAILWLHGKPTNPALSDEERSQIIADGFRFYAWLYRLLGVLLWIVGAALWFCNVFETSRQAIYCVGSFFLLGGFLWFASGLGFRGSHSLRNKQNSARLVLVAFMVAIIAFLSALIAALSVVVQLETEQSATLNLVVAALLWVFGVGSYLIEVLYLVGETRI